ncbi:MAG: hypothetical protein MJ016_02610, partial [Victivallaceae bacterium]|nr:hypothetical protein [Victivallaceae bacterium]
MSKLDSTTKRRIDRSIGSALFSDTERMEMWFADHWKRIAVAAVALVVAVTAVFAVVRYARAREVEAARTLQKAPTDAELTQALDKYHDSVGAPYERTRL